MQIKIWGYFEAFLFAVCHQLTNHRSVVKETEITASSICKWWCAQPLLKSSPTMPCKLSQGSHREKIVLFWLLPRTTLKTSFTRLNCSFLFHLHSAYLEYQAVQSVTVALSPRNGNMTPRWESLQKILNSWCIRSSRYNGQQTDIVLYLPGTLCSRYILCSGCILNTW